jgi:hypothetical protein
LIPHFKLLVENQPEIQESAVVQNHVLAYRTPSRIEAHKTLVAKKPKSNAFGPKSSKIRKMGLQGPVLSIMPCCASGRSPSSRLLMPSLEDIADKFSMGSAEIIPRDKAIDRWYITNCRGSWRQTATLDQIAVCCAE